MRVVVSEAPAPIPLGCVCAYTWSGFAGRQVRNGAVASCGADHTAVDRVGAGGSPPAEPRVLDGDLALVSWGPVLDPPWPT